MYVHTDTRGSDCLLLFRRALNGEQVQFPGGFEHLIERYQEPHRRYHTLRHLVEGWDLLDEIIGVPAADGLYFAWAFHDAVYTPGSDRGKEVSAQNAIMADAMMGQIFGGGFSRLISHTQHHLGAETLDQGLIIDVDLSIFGMSEERYCEYEEQLRQEYPDVEMMVYCSERRKVLEAFLKRPRIYNTNHFYNRFEASARKNLTKTVQVLRKRCMGGSLFG